MVPASDPEVPSTRTATGSLWQVTVGGKSDQRVETDSAACLRPDYLTAAVAAMLQQLA